MKKVLAIVLAALMLLSLAACSTSSGDNKDESKPNVNAAAEENSVDVDMSKYPSDLDKWSGQNFIDYFKEVGVFKDGGGFETWLQDHNDYWPGTPVGECAGWWSTAESGDMTNVMIFIFNPNNADTSEEDLNEWKDYIREHKSLMADYSSLPIDHLIGNVAFSFETSIMDDDIYKAMSDAYNNLVKVMNVTPEF